MRLLSSIQRLLRRLLNALQSLLSRSLSRFHRLLIGGEWVAEKAHVGLHRLLCESLERFLLLLGLLLQLLYQGTSALRLAFEGLHSLGKKALDKLHVALLDGRDVLRHSLMCLEYLHSLREEALSKLRGTLLSGDDTLCSGLTCLEDLHAFTEEALRKLRVALLGGDDTLYDGLVCLLKGFDQCPCGFIDFLFCHCFSPHLSRSRLRYILPVTCLRFTNTYHCMRSWHPFDAGHPAPVWIRRPGWMGPVVSCRQPSTLPTRPPSRSIRQSSSPSVLEALRAFIHAALKAVNTRTSRRSVLDNHGHALTAPDTQGRQPVVRIASLHFIEQGDQHPRPTGSNRVA